MWALIVVSALITLVSALVLWVNRQVVHDQGWQDTSAQVIRSPATRAAAATYLVDQLYQNVDVKQAIESQLPKNLQHFAGPLSAALRQPAVSAVEAALGRPRLQRLWIGATARAHHQLVNVLENKTGYGISTGNGVVKIDLDQLVREAGADIGLPASVLSRIPTGAGEVTVMRSNQLAAAQTGFHILTIANVWLVVLALALFALAIDLARGWRREALRGSGWALLVVGLILLIVRRSLGNYIVGAIAAPDYRPAIHDIWWIGTSQLSDVGWGLVFYGVVTVVGTILAGPSRWATSLRRHAAPTIVHRPGVYWGSAAVLYLLVVLWGPTYALRKSWGILLLAGLSALGLYVFRRVVERDLTPAATPPAAELDRVKTLPV